MLVLISFVSKLLNFFISSLLIFTKARVLLDFEKFSQFFCFCVRFILDLVLKEWNYIENVF